MRRSLAIAVGILLGCSSAAGRGHNGELQKVFTDMAGGGNELVMDIDRGQLRIRRPAWLDDTGQRFQLDGLTFGLEWNEVEKQYQELNVDKRLTVQKETLLFDGRPVALPAGLKMRNIWQSILWNGYVICIGRTSNTDENAKRVPPSFASELITFSVAKRDAAVRYLSPMPPGSRPRLQVLTAR